jgi:hypothetical protein
MALWLPELAVLAVVLHFSLQWGIVMAVAEMAVTGFTLCNRLYKMIRVFQTVNENRIFAIMERLNISDEDVKRAFATKVMPLMSETQLAQLDKDFTEFGL